MSVVVFCMFFTSQEINTKRNPNATELFVVFYGPEDIQWAEEAPGGLFPPWLPPEPPLYSINTPIFQKP